MSSLLLVGHMMTLSWMVSLHLRSHLTISSRLVGLGRMMSHLRRSVMVHFLMMLLSMTSDSAHSAELMLLIRMDWHHFPCFHLHLLFLFSFYGLLLSFHVFLLLILVIVKHIPNFSQMINLCISTVESIIFVSALNDIIPSFFLSQLFLTSIIFLVLVGIIYHGLCLIFVLDFSLLCV